MKIVMTFDQNDVRKLIEEHLRAQGIKVNMDLAKYSGSAKITVEVDGSDIEREDEPLPAPKPAAVPVPLLNETRAVGPSPAPEEPDLDEIMEASKHLEDKTRSIYPPAERRYMEGESDEFPGVPTRGR